VARQRNGFLVHNSPGKLRSETLIGLEQHNGGLCII